MQGNVQCLWSAPTVDKPCFQVVDIQALGAKYKVKLTDGSFWAEAMFCGSAAELVVQQKLAVNVAVRPVDWTLQRVQKKKTGTSQDFVFVKEAVVLGPLPQWQCADLHSLRQYPERTSSITSSQLPPATQELPSTTANLPMSNDAAYTTPEKRGGNQAGTGIMDTTPPALPQPFGGAPAAAPVTTAGSLGAGAVGGAASPFDDTQPGLPGFDALSSYAPPRAAASASATGAAGMGLQGFGALSSYAPPRAAASTSATGAAGMRGSVAPAAGDAGCLPISELSPYTNGRWRIKARLVAKEGIRRFTNARGEGQLFKVDLVDRGGGEISATFFGRAVDRYHDMMRLRQVYYISRGSIKPANKRFDRGDVVISLDENCIVEMAEEDPSIPGMSYNFVPIDSIAQTAVGTSVDIKGVIAEARDTMTIMVKSTQRERLKRDLVVWDDSGSGGACVDVTIWGDIAADEFQVGAVIYVRAARVAEWNGAHSLNLSGHFELNPDDSRAFALLGAFEAAGRPGGGSSRSAGGGAGASFISGTRETIAECREADLHLGGAQGMPGGPKPANRHFVQAAFTCISEDRPPFYFACPEQVERTSATGATQSAGATRSCNKKMTQEGQNCWRCAGGHSHAAPVARYMCQRVQILDHSGAFEISFFDEVGRRIFGCDAGQLSEVWEDGSREAERREFLRRASWRRLQFRLRSAREIWNDEERTKVTADDAGPIDYAKDGRRLLSDIAASLAAE